MKKSQAHHTSTHKIHVVCQVELGAVLIVGSRAGVAPATAAVAAGTAAACPMHMPQCRSVYLLLSVGT